MNIRSGEEHPDERLTASVTAASASVPTSIAPKSRADDIDFIDAGARGEAVENHNAGALEDEELMMRNKHSRDAAEIDGLRLFRLSVTHQFFQVCVYFFILLESGATSERQRRDQKSRAQRRAAQREVQRSRGTKPKTPAEFGTKEKKEKRELELARYIGSA